MKRLVLSAMFCLAAYAQMPQGQVTKGSITMLCLRVPASMFHAGNSPLGVTAPGYDMFQVFLNTTDPQTDAFIVNVRYSEEGAEKTTALMVQRHRALGKAPEQSSPGGMSIKSGVKVVSVTVSELRSFSAESF